MIILGIDPGSRNCGYGLLELERRTITKAGCGVIDTGKNQLLSNRIKQIYQQISKIIVEYKPDRAAVETIFYGKNIKSAFTLGHVRGAILLALSQNNVPIEEYSPREIKKSVVGNGNASKQQVQYMIEKILNIKIGKMSSDASDAIAAALCLYNKIKYTL